MNAVIKRWAAAGETKVPYWVYTDNVVYQSELERIWYGPHWLYAGLEAEIPTVGSYRTTTLGERSVIVIRGAEDQIFVLENRCRHRGVKICQARSGKIDTITCPYHQWSYALDGALQGVPFRRGIKGKGGMSADFSPSDHGLTRLKVEVVNGAIWASFSNSTPPFREYIGEELWASYEQLFSGRRLRVVGYNRQSIPANWKAMEENFRDPYHSALLHVFLATFGLFRPDQSGEMRMDKTGRHSYMLSLPPRAESALSEKEDIKHELAFDASLQLADKRLVEAVRELKGDTTVRGVAVFPGTLLLQQLNSLQVRQCIPKGPNGFELIWTYFGFEDDDDVMRQRRIRHGNLFGPAGLVSADDGEVMAWAHRSFKETDETGDVILEMGKGGRETKNEGHMATERTIRGMYQYYREVMGL